jgi:hypothetical protein
VAAKLSSKIVAAHRDSRCLASVRDLQNRLAFRAKPGARIDERPQDGERERRMDCLDRIIKRDRQIRAAGQGTNPIVAFADKTSDGPGRQFECDLLHRRVDPRPRLGQFIK